MMVPNYNRGLYLEGKSLNYTLSTGLSHEV